jgi:hypothetical protein
MRRRALEPKSRLFSSPTGGRGAVESRRDNTMRGSLHGSSSGETRRGKVRSNSSKTDSPASGRRRCVAPLRGLSCARVKNADFHGERAERRTRHLAAAGPKMRGNDRPTARPQRSIRRWVYSAEWGPSGGSGRLSVAIFAGTCS